MGYLSEEEKGVGKVKEYKKWGWHSLRVFNDIKSSTITLKLYWNEKLENEDVKFSHTVEYKKEEDIPRLIDETVINISEQLGVKRNEEDYSGIAKSCPFCGGRNIAYHLAYTECGELEYNRYKLTQTAENEN